MASLINFKKCAQLSVLQSPLQQSGTHVFIFYHLDSHQAISYILWVADNHALMIIILLWVRYLANSLPIPFVLPCYLGTPTLVVCYLGLEMT